MTSLGRRSFIFWLTAVLCWINDKLYCEIWSSIGFPYLHGFWHVLIFLAAYTAVVLFAYFDVKQNHPHETPLIQYWPIDSFELGIPYCQLKSYHLNKKEHHIWEKNFTTPKIELFVSIPPSPLLHIHISDRCFLKNNILGRVILCTLLLWVNNLAISNAFWTDPEPNCMNIIFFGLFVSF